MSAGSFQHNNLYQQETQAPPTLKAITSFEKNRNFTPSFWGKSFLPFIIFVNIFSRMYIFLIFNLWAENEMVLEHLETYK